MSARSERQEAELEKRVQAILEDQSWDFLRGPAARRFLCLLAGATWVATTLTFWFLGSLGLAALALLFLVYLGLRVSVRSLADLPERFLDERQRAIRNKAYLGAYLAIATVLSVFALAILGWVFLTDSRGLDSYRLDLSFGQVQATIWFFFGAMLLAPSVILAWDEASRKG